MKNLIYERVSSFIGMTIHVNNLIDYFNQLFLLTLYPDTIKNPSAIVGGILFTASL
ncbi:hypothetical protein [Chryseobacterium sp. SIMBA_029]|uniref:hypothetical protein n=1 Tax=Chryseobacterium sp. SIMBA_029 TaxID=3085772 RepID=UPI00397B6F92